MFRLVPGFNVAELRILGRDGSGHEHGMLSWLIIRLRSCSAITLVVLYAACVVLPSAALAFPSGRAPTHCLTNVRLDITGAQLQDGITIHTPSDSAIHEHAGDSKEGGDGKLKCHVGACCGFSCAAAITGDSADIIVRPVQASLLFRRLDESLDGCGPERISRPPKSFLSL